MLTHRYYRTSNAGPLIDDIDQNRGSSTRHSKQGLQMSILPTNTIRPSALRAAPGRRPAGFAVAEQPAKLGEATALTALSTDALLFLQEVESPQERDARSRRHGTALLDLLAKLQHGLLDGAAPGEVLQDLQALTTQPIVAANPGLQDVVAAITLRAHVEIARATSNTCERSQ